MGKHKDGVEKSRTKDAQRVKPEEEPPSLILRGILLAVSAIIATVAMVIATYWSTLVRTKELMFPDVGRSFNLAGCKNIDPTLFGCEDIVVVGDYAYMACSDPAGRAKWFPPAHYFDESANHHDKLYVYDFKKSTLKPIEVQNYQGDFFVHGLSAIEGSKPNEVRFGIVNHRKSGSCIELFNHQKGTLEFVHKESVCHGLISSPNNLAFISPDAFYVTNFYPRASGTPRKSLTYWGILESIFAGPTSTLAFRDEDGSVRIVRRDLAGANGIARSTSGKLLYIAESSSGEVSLWDIQDDHSVRRSTSHIALPFLPDNINVIPETGAITVAGPLGAWKFLQGALHQFKYRPTDAQGRSKQATKDDDTSVENYPGPSMAVMITNATRSFYGGKYAADTLVRDAVGTTLYSASVIAVHWPTKGSLIGGPFMHGVYQCPWPEKFEPRRQTVGTTPPPRRRRR